MATKKSNKQLFILLALIVAVAAAILLLPSCGRSEEHTSELQSQR